EERHAITTTACRKDAFHNRDGRCLLASAPQTLCYKSHIFISKSHPSCCKARPPCLYAGRKREASRMKREDRQRSLLEILVETGSASLEVLSQRFGVSKMTIHRDLDELEKEGLLRKVRGGATIEASGQFESDFRYRARQAAEEKRQIAR